jgi:transcriptional regulator with XRE-family HTH domain
MPILDENAREKFDQKEYRDAYVAENLKSGIAFQILYNREARKWTQESLGEKTGQGQNGIARLENPFYGRFTLKTLLKIASAFDVALLVKFVPFSRFLDELKDVSPEALIAPTYEDEFNNIRREISESESYSTKIMEFHDFEESENHDENFLQSSGVYQPINERNVA